MRQNSSFGIPSVRWLLLFSINAAAPLRLFCIYLICDFFSTCQIIRRKYNLNREIYFSSMRSKTQNGKQRDKNPFENWIFRFMYEYFWLMINLFSLSLAWFAYARIFSTFFITFALKFRKQELLVFSFARAASKQANNVWRVTTKWRQKTCNSLCGSKRFRWRNLLLTVIAIKPCRKE